MIRTVILAAALLAVAPAFAAPNAPQPGPAPAATHVAANPETARVDINSATVEQLAAVKGLNRGLAEAIIKGRPYKSEDELTKRGVLPEPAFKEAKGALTVKHN